MKVILLRDIPKVGKNGDVVNVADGYGRNYLFPRGYAVAAVGGALKDHDARLARESERGSRALGSAQADAAKLTGATVQIIGRAGAGTKLYGSITASDVSAAIQTATGVTVDRRRIGLADPIKSLGDYSVPVRLHSEVIVDVRVSVLTEEELAKRQAQADAAPAE